VQCAEYEPGDKDANYTSTPTSCVFKPKGASQQGAGLDTANRQSPADASIRRLDEGLEGEGETFPSEAEAPLHDDHIAPAEGGATNARTACSFRPTALMVITPARAALPDENMIHETARRQRVASCTRGSRRVEWVVSVWRAHV